MRTPPSGSPASGRLHDKRRRRRNRAGDDAVLADVLSPRRSNDKLRGVVAAEPAAPFDVAAADAREIDCPVTKPSRLLVFANPAAGKGEADAVLGRIAQLLRIEQITLDVHHAGGAEALSAAAHGARLKGVDGVLVLGGDGTINAVVHGLLSRPATDVIPPLAIMPLGTGNALACDLGVTDIETGIARLLVGETRPVDVISVTAGERLFHALTIVGWGLAADVSGTAQSWRLLGQRSYGMALRLETLRSKPRYARLEVALAGRGEEMVQGPYTMLLLANTRHTGHGMLVAPRAAIDDGLLDLVEVLPVGLTKRIQTLRSLWDGSHLDSPAVRWRHVRGVTLSQPSLAAIFGGSGEGAGEPAPAEEPRLAGAPQADGKKRKPKPPEPVRLNIDGDLIDLPHDAEVRITVLPRALRFYAPKDLSAQPSKR
jgi:diacylglycerol kinase family enzyme